MSSSRDPPNQGTNPHLSSPALAGRVFTTSATWEAPSHYRYMSYFQKQENCKICNSLSNIETLV